MRKLSLCSTAFRCTQHDPPEGDRLRDPFDRRCFALGAELRERAGHRGIGGQGLGDHDVAAAALASAAHAGSVTNLQYLDAARCRSELRA